MNELSSSMSLIFTRRDSRRIIIVSTFFFLFILLLVQNGSMAFSVLSFTNLPFFEQISLFIKTLFDVNSTFTISTFILAVLGSLFGAINLSLAYTYMKVRGEVIVQSGLFSGTGLVLAFVGIGCAACGTALLSVILGFFGLSAMLSLLPYQGEEVGYIGLLILFIATYTLAKRVASPLVC